MRNAGDQFHLRRRVAGELIGHDGTRHIPTSFEELADEAFRAFRISALLHQYVEYFPALIDCESQVHEFTFDLAEHLIEMPRAPGLSSMARQPLYIICAEFQTPQPDRLLRAVHATLQHHLLDIAKARAEAKAQPDAVGDDIAWEAVSMVARGGRGIYLPIASSSALFDNIHLCLPASLSWMDLTVAAIGSCARVARQADTPFR